MKVLITATVQSHICQFHLPLVKMLKSMGYTVDVAAKDNLSVKPGLKLEDADNVFDVPFSRSPFSADNIKAYGKLKKIIRENDYDIIHCNTPMGSVVTRLAADTKKTAVIYTAHGFHFFKGAPIKNWLFYFPIEWLLSFKTDFLICINREDYAFAKKRLHCGSAEYVHGVGFDSNRFAGAPTKKEAKRSLGISEDETVLLSVGDICRRKNHKVIIEALARIKDINARFYIAGWDMMNGWLERLAEKLGVSEKVTFLGYTRQLSEYFEAADIFLFPSLQEGLPVALIEAMSRGLPVVASDIRGTNDLIDDGDGGYLLKTSDICGFAEKIKLLAGDGGLREKFGERNKCVSKEYEVRRVMNEMRKIYEKAAGKAENESFAYSDGYTDCQRHNERCS